MLHSVLAKFISTINVANRGYYRTIRVQNNKLVFLIIQILDEYGVIRGYKLDKYNDKIKIYLKYRSGFSMIFEVKQVSKESKRVYVSLLDLYKLKNKYGKIFYILSTTKGLLSDDECMRYKIGGEVICKIVL